MFMLVMLHSKSESISTRFYDRFQDMIDWEYKVKNDYFRNYLTVCLECGYMDLAKTLFGMYYMKWIKKPNNLQIVARIMAAKSNSSGIDKFTSWLDNNLTKSIFVTNIVYYAWKFNRPKSLKKGIDLKVFENFEDFLKKQEPKTLEEISWIFIFKLYKNSKSLLQKLKTRKFSINLEEISKLSDLVNKYFPFNMSYLNLLYHEFINHFFHEFDLQQVTQFISDSQKKIS